MFLAAIEDVQVRHGLETLYHLYHKELWYVANDILKDEHEAQDVVQTAFIRVAKYIDQDFDPKCNKSRALIVIIVRNLAFDAYRKRQRQSTVVFDEVIHGADSQTYEPAEIRMIRLDNRHWVAEQLAELKSGYGDILTLKYVYDYSDQEIASLLEISEGNVRTRLSRARKALKKVIGGETLEAEC